MRRMWTDSGNIEGSHLAVPSMESVRKRVVAKANQQQPSCIDRRSTRPALLAAVADDYSKNPDGKRGRTGAPVGLGSREPDHGLRLVGSPPPTTRGGSSADGKDAAAMDENGQPGVLPNLLARSRPLVGTPLDVLLANLAPMQCE